MDLTICNHKFLSMYFSDLLSVGNTIYVCFSKTEKYIKMFLSLSGLSQWLGLVRFLDLTLGYLKFCV